MGFSNVEYMAGPYFQAREQGTGVTDSRGVQIDLIFDRKDSVITVCEVKYSDTPIGIDLIQETDRKLALIPNRKNKTIQKALITKSPPSQQLKDQAYLSHIVQLEELIGTS